MNVPRFYNLIPYKKCLSIVCDVNNEIRKYDAFKIKSYLVKVLKHIAHSQAISIYPKSQKHQYKEALKWLYRAEMEIKGLNIPDKDKIKYKVELNEVRKLLIVLDKKVKMEED